MRKRYGFSLLLGEFCVLCLLRCVCQIVISVSMLSDNKLYIITIIIFGESAP